MQIKVIVVVVAPDYEAALIENRGILGRSSVLVKICGAVCI